LRSLNIQNGQDDPVGEADPLPAGQVDEHSWLLHENPVSSAANSVPENLTQTSAFPDLPVRKKVTARAGRTEAALQEASRLSEAAHLACGLATTKSLPRLPMTSRCSVNSLA
jgi:hypothetical protein